MRYIQMSLVVSWEDYFQLISTSGLGPKYYYIDKEVTELPWWLPMPPTDHPISFSHCEKLTDISVLEDWDMSKVTSLESMFNHCYALRDIRPLANWDVSNVTTMKCMFNCCRSLEDISPLAEWDIQSDTNMRFIFNGCSQLPDFTRNQIKDMAGWRREFMKQQEDDFLSATDSYIFRSERFLEDYFQHHEEEFY